MEVVVVALGCLAAERYRRADDIVRAPGPLGKQQREVADAGR